MKFAFAITTVLLIAATVTFNANSDEPKSENASLKFNTSELGKQLLDTLAMSYEQHLELYRRGTASPARAVEVNRELYEAQRDCVEASQKLATAERFVARAKEIENIATKHLDSGSGSSVDVLDAKAPRLRAEIELATVSASSK